MVRDQPKILIVDDDEVDVMELRRELKSHRISNPVHVAEDGLEALSLLRGEDGSDPLDAPYVILLDLNMPRMTGLEFLQEIRNDPAMREAIIFVLTTSNAERDRVESYRHNVAGYILKAGMGQDMTRAMQMLSAYLDVVQFP